MKANLLFMAMAAMLASGNATVDGQNVPEGRRIGPGVYLDHAYLTKYGHAALGTALRGHPAITILKGSNSRAWAVRSATHEPETKPLCPNCVLEPLEALLTSTDIALGARRACYMDVYLNENLVYMLGEPVMPLFDLNKLHPASVEAVTLYKASEVPPQYTRNPAGCGVIMISLRVGGR